MSSFTVVLYLYDYEFSTKLCYSCQQIIEVDRRVSLVLFCFQALSCWISFFSGLSEEELTTKKCNLVLKRLITPSNFLLQINIIILLHWIYPAIPFPIPALSQPKRIDDWYYIGSGSCHGDQAHVETALHSHLIYLWKIIVKKKTRPEVKALRPAFHYRCEASEFIITDVRF